MWFRGDEYFRAIKVFGVPDYVHIGFDTRCRREIAEGDTVVFARGEWDQTYHPYKFNDINEQE